MQLLYLFCSLLLCCFSWRVWEKLTGFSQEIFWPFPSLNLFYLRSSAGLQNFTGYSSQLSLWFRMFCSKSLNWSWWVLCLIFVVLPFVGRYVSNILGFVSVVWGWGFWYGFFVLLRLRFQWRTLLDLCCLGLVSVFGYRGFWILPVFFFYNLFSNGESLSC